MDQQIIPTTQEPNDPDVPKNIKKQKVFQGFCYAGHAMLDIKINENHNHIFKKTTFKTMFQLRSILEATWLRFWRIWGANLGLSWHQMAS